MKNQPAVETKKIAAILVLYTVSAGIALTGAVFSILSFLNDISFTVLGSQIHGAIFGIVITFLGVRYFVSVRTLRNEVYKPTSQFSWANFKRKSRKTGQNA